MQKMTLSPTLLYTPTRQIPTLLYTYSQKGTPFGWSLFVQFTIGNYSAEGGGHLTL